MTNHKLTSRQLKLLGMELADFVHELTEAHEEIVEDEYGETVRGRMPGLLAQLWSSDIPASASPFDSAPGSMSFESRPAARIEALDTAARIDLEVERWLARLGATPRNADSTVMVRQLHGLAASQDPRTRREITAAARSWWIWARVITGWDAPAWTPDVTCPQCGERGTVKVRIRERFASCVNDQCRITWDSDTIELLGLHIKAETYDRQSAWRNVGPCWCPWPEPDVTSLRRLCPRCGSARCHRAIAMGRLDSLRLARGA